MTRVLAVFDDLPLGSDMLGMQRTGAASVGPTGAYSHVDVDTRRRAALVRSVLSWCHTTKDT